MGRRSLNWVGSAGAFGAALWAEEAVLADAWLGFYRGLLLAQAAARLLIAAAQPRPEAARLPQLPSLLGPLPLDPLTHSRLHALASDPAAKAAALRWLLHQWELLEQDRQAKEQEGILYSYKAPPLLSAPGPLDDTADPDVELEKLRLFPLPTDQTQHWLPKRSALCMEDLAQLLLRLSSDFVPEAKSLGDWDLVRLALSETSLFCSADSALVAMQDEALAWSVGETKPESQRNPYRDGAGPAEVAELLAALATLDAKITLLLEEQPESEILLSLLESTTVLRETPVWSPLMRLGSAVETVLGRCEEWDKHSGRERSLSTASQALKALLLRWRKAELRSWERLLHDADKETIVHNAALGLPILHAALHPTPDSDQEAPDVKAQNQLALASALQWLQGSSLQDFVPRLSFLKSLVGSLEILGEAEERTLSWESLAAHWEIFRPAAEQKATELAAEVRQQLQDLVRIAKFQDLNHWSIKESSAKVHRQLMGLLKKYKASLQIPLLGLTEDVILPDAAESQSGESLWMPNVEWAGGRDEDTAAKARMVVRHGQELLSGLTESEGVESLEWSLELLRSVGPELATAESYKGTKEEQVKEMRRAQQRKRTLFSQLLKELKKRGVRDRAGLRVDEAVLSEELLLGLSPDSAAPGLAALRLVAHARTLATAALRKAHAQLDPRLIQVLQGLTQFFPHKLITNFRAVEKPTLSLRRLQALDGLIRSAQKAHLPPQRSVRSALSVLESKMGRLTNDVRHLTRLLQTLPKDPELSSWSSLPFAKPTLSAYQISQLKTLGAQLAEWLGTAKVPTLGEDEPLSRAFVERLAEGLESSLPDGLLESIQSVVADDLSPAMEPLEMAKASLGEARAALRALLKPLHASAEAPLELEEERRSVLLVVQRLVKAKEAAESAKDSHSLFTAAGLKARLLSECGLSDLVSGLEAKLSDRALGDADKDALDRLRPILTTVASLLHSLLESYAQSAGKTSQLYLELMRVVVGLARDGFVRPLPSGKEGGEEGAGEGKTADPDPDDDAAKGMGQGEGLKDVGAEMEETGQVDGLQDQTEPEQSGAPEDADTPLDMDEDFGGDLEDLNLDDPDDEDDADDKAPEEDWEKGETEEDKAQEQLDPNLWDEEKEEKKPEQTEIDPEAANEKDDQVQGKENDAQAPEKEDKEAGAAAEDEPGADDELGEDEELMEQDTEQDQQQDSEEPAPQGPDAQDEPEKDEDDADDSSAEAKPGETEADAPMDEQSEDEGDVDKEAAEVEPDKSEAAEEGGEEKVASRDQTQPQEGPDGDEQLPKPEDRPTEDRDKEEEGDGDAENQSMPNKDGLQRKALGPDEASQPDSAQDGPKSSGKDQRSLAEQRSETKRDGQVLPEPQKADIEEAQKGPEDAALFSHAADLADGAVEMADSATLEEVVAQRRAAPEPDLPDTDSPDSALPPSPEMDQDAAATATDAPANPSADSKPDSHGRGDELTHEEPDEESQGPKDQVPKTKLESSVHMRQVEMRGGGGRREAELAGAPEPEEGLEENVEGRAEWERCVAATSSLSAELAESLRLVLEPTRASRLQGDYRSGKRLNLRKLIPYVASNFRKDKIWLRRTLKKKREYRILLALDDSESMREKGAWEMAGQALAVLSAGLGLLEAGELGVASFGTEARLLHPLGQALDAAAGPRVLSQLSFRQPKTALLPLLSALPSWLGPGEGGAERLVLIVSDGRGLFAEGMDETRRRVAELLQSGLFLVFLVLDSRADDGDSITDVQVPIFGADGSLVMRSYLELFPFPFYVLLRSVDHLPASVAEALRQWIQSIHA